MKSLFFILGLVLSLSLVSADDDYISVSTDDAQNDHDLQNALSFGIDALLARIARKNLADTNTLTQAIQSIAYQNVSDGTNYQFQVYLTSPAGDFFSGSFVVHSDSATGDLQITQSSFNSQPAPTYTNTADSSNVQALTAQIEDSNFVQDLFSTGLQTLLSSAISSGIIPNGEYTTVGAPSIFKRGDGEIYNFGVDVSDGNGNFVHIIFGVNASDGSIVSSSFTSASAESSSFVTSARNRSLRGEN